MEALGHTGYSLSKELGTSEAVISNIRNGKNPPNIGLVRDLLNKYVDVDPDWLLFGRGSLRRGVPGATGAIQAEDGQVTLSDVDKRLAGLEGLIKRSLHAQLDRAIVEDEAMADIEDRIASLEKRLEDVRKGPDKKR